MGSKKQKNKINRSQNVIRGWKSPIAIHPGLILKDFLDDFDITQKELAKRTDISKKIINEIVNKKNPITHETAYKLAKVFNESPKFWIDLQKMYELDKAGLDEEEKVRKESEKYINNTIHETYRELCSHGLVKEYRWVKKYYKDIMIELQKYFGIDSLDYIKDINLGVAFRKYRQKKVNQYTLAAWLRLGEKKAYKTKINPFNEHKLKNSLNEIKFLSNKRPSDYLKELESVLASLGIVLVYAPYFKNTYVQGATQWMAKDKAFIILKTTKQGEDKFWFNLFHELGHLLLHGKKKLFIDFDKDGNKTELENEADEFAREKLIPNFENYIGQYGNLKDAVDNIADKSGVAKSIVAGRIAYENKDKKVAWKITSNFIQQINKVNI